MHVKHPEYIYDLWDKLAEFDASRSDEALFQFMQGLCASIGARDAVWMGAVRMDTSFPDDPVQGWRPRVIRRLHPKAHIEAAVQEQMEKLERGDADETTIRNLDGVGTFRVNRLRDLVGSEWFDSSYYRLYYQGIGYADAVWAATPVNQDTESWFGIFRGPHMPPFSETERDEIAGILRGIKWFQKQLMLSYGLVVAKVPLTPAERKVLHLLLTGLPEKLIANQLERSYHTTHEQTRSIYHKFGVKNRAALMALWLGQAS
jgi:DNA-binding CsgD family transcriptional regulator